MSYILDALKKAAEQRSSAPNEVRRLLSPAPVAPESVWRYIGVGTIAAGVLGVILAAWLWAGAARQDETAPATPVASVVPAPPVPAGPAGPARHMPAAIERPLDVVTRQPRHRAEDAVTSQPPRATPDAVSPQPRHPATESRRESPTTNSVPRVTSAAEAQAATAAAPRPTTGDDARATTPGEPSGARSTTPARATKAPLTGATATAPPASTSPTPIPAVAAVPSAPSTGAPIRSDLGKLKVEVIVYSEQRPLRWAFISGRKYVEGDTIGDGARVEEIQSGGVVIVEDGRRVTLRP